MHDLRRLDRLIDPPVILTSAGEAHQTALLKVLCAEITCRQPVKKAAAIKKILEQPFVGPLVRHV